MIKLTEKQIEEIELLLTKWAENKMSHSDKELKSWVQLEFLFLNIAEEYNERSA